MASGLKPGMGTTICRELCVPLEAVTEPLTRTKKVFSICRLLFTSKSGDPCGESQPTCSEMQETGREVDTRKGSYHV